MELVKEIIDYSTNFISSGGIPFGFFLVLIECFIPILPLSVFIALNVNAFGLFTGVFISWIATTIGSYLCYLLFYFFEKKIQKLVYGKRIIGDAKKKIDTFRTISFSNLVLLITLPFTPAFLINIVGGLAKIPKDKFLLALIIGKSFSTTFWGYIGKSFLSSLTDLKSLIFIGITLIIAFIISKVIGHKMNIE